jgi:DDE family transposase
VSCAGRVPVLRLARQAGLEDLAAEWVRLPGPAGANTPDKILSVVAGMVVGADSIDDLDLLRHGALGRLASRVKAPSTLGTFLRAFTHGHVRQLQALSARLLANLVAQTPLLPGADALAYLDVDSSIWPVHGYQKQGAAFGYTRQRGLHPLIATLCTPLSAPVIVASQLRGGAAHTARGAATLLTGAIRTARAAGATGRLIVRADSGFYNGPIVSACRRAGAAFSITARLDRAVRRAIAGIPEQAWTPIHYPQAVLDPDTGQLISNAEVAETSYTAFTGRHRITTRLVVRRVRDLAEHPDQTELLPAWRYHAFLTDTALSTVDADRTHRQHAIIEQVIADLKASAAAHLPSGRFTANAAWLTLATIAFNLTRAAATLAGTNHARAATATLRHHLINVPARVTSSGRRIRLRLPLHWPWADAWLALHTALGHT